MACRPAWQGWPTGHIHLSPRAVHARHCANRLGPQPPPSGARLRRGRARCWCSPPIPLLGL
eukprot:3082725-Pleurochrysis_carterae.AAC.1